MLERRPAPTLREFDELVNRAKSHEEVAAATGFRDIREAVYVPDDEFGHEHQVSPIFWLQSLLEAGLGPVVHEINCDARATRVASQEVLSGVKAGANSTVFFTAGSFERVFDLTTHIKEVDAEDVPLVPVGVHSPKLLKLTTYDPTEFQIAGVDFVVIPEHYDPNVVLPVVQAFEALGIIPLVSMGIFHDPSMLLWAHNHLDLGVTRAMYHEVASRPDPLFAAVEFAVNYAHMLYDFGARGVVITFPESSKRNLIYKALGPLLKAFLAEHQSRGDRW
ncbi:MAG: hypothetical protein Kow0069_00990 [Promethearchaeota archaeon]